MEREEEIRANFQAEGNDNVDYRDVARVLNGSTPTVPRRWRIVLAVLFDRGDLRRHLEAIFCRHAIGASVVWRAAETKPMGSTVIHSIRDKGVERHANSASLKAGFSYEF